MSLTGVFMTNHHVKREQARKSSVTQTAPVFVVAVKLMHGLVAFISALGRAVEDRVVAHQELRAAGVARVAVVDGLALAGERAEAVSLREIALEVRPARARVPARDLRQALADRRLLVQQLQQPELVGLEHRRGRVVRRTRPCRYAVVKVAVASSGRPVLPPTQPLHVSGELLVRLA